MVNEEFARQYLPPDPVGMVFPWTVDDRDAELEIVGMVQNTLKDGLDRQPQPEFYKVLKSGIWGDIKLVIRTAGAPAVRAPTVLALVRDVAPEAAVEALPLTERLARSVARPRFLTIVSLVFAALAIALACGGLAAVLAHNLAQRQLELSIRAALGASGGHLLRMVLWEAASQTLLGVLMGLVAAAVLTRYMDTLLFGVAPLDATAFAVPVAVLLPLAAVVALPRALHAMRVDPARALRCE
jgi:putative ABC transport system permease protein